MVSISSDVRKGISEAINLIGESVTIYNSTQTTDSDTAYESIITDDFIDGTNTGTSETAVIQPVKERKDQMAEGRLIEGDLLGFFKHDSVITSNSLVKVASTNYLYKVKEIHRYKISGVLYHYEIILEFIREVV